MIPSAGNRTLLRIADPHPAASCAHEGLGRRHGVDPNVQRGGRARGRGHPGFVDGPAHVTICPIHARAPDPAIGVRPSAQRHGRVGRPRRDRGQPLRRRARAGRRRAAARAGRRPADRAAADARHVRHRRHRDHDARARPGPRDDRERVHVRLARAAARAHLGRPAHQDVRAPARGPHVRRQRPVRDAERAVRPVRRPDQPRRARAALRGRSTTRRSSAARSRTSSPTSPAPTGAATTRCSSAASSTPATRRARRCCSTAAATSGSAPPPRRARTRRSARRSSSASRRGAGAGCTAPPR